MTTIHPVPTRAVPAARPASWLVRGALFFFAQPLRDGVARHAKGSRQATQAAAFFVGSQNLIALLCRVAVRLRRLPTTAPTVVTVIPLLPVFREAVLHQPLAAAMQTANHFDYHARDSTTPLPLEPLPSREDWLANYQRVDWVEYTLTRLAKRVRRGEMIATGIADLHQNYEDFENSFTRFFPELITFVAQEKLAWVLDEPAFSR